MSQITLIEPRRRSFLPDFSELYKYRDLFRTLVERDVKVRYKQTVVGGLWALIQPFFTMIVFTVFFGNVAKIPSDNAPYAVFSYSGLVLWTYFSNALSSASNSLIQNETLVSKVYFPRILIPSSATFVGLLDYLIALVLVFGLMVYFNYPPTTQLLLIPLTVLLTWLLASGLGFWLSAFNVKYRDVRFAIPFFIRLLLFITPVIYPVSLAGKYELLLALNPMSGLIETHRIAILSHQPVDWGLLGVSITLTAAIFISGNIYFKSVERYFADII